MNTYKIKFIDRWDKTVDSIHGSGATMKQMWKELANGKHSEMWYVDSRTSENDAVVAHLCCVMNGTEVFLESMNSPVESKMGEIWLGRFEGVMC